MKNVILIHPKVGYWDDIRNAPSLPLALLCISRYLKDYNVKIIDQRLDKDWKKSVRDNINDDTLCVGVTSITGTQIKYAVEVSEFVKSISTVPVVWGGIHASLMPEQTLENENIDIVVEGEGEITFFELVKSLDKGGGIEGIKGLWYKTKDGIKYNGQRDFVDMNEFPPIPYNIIDIKKYLPLFGDDPTLYIQTSRGCPQRCLYCFNPVYNRRKWRSMSAEKVIEELRYLIEEYGIKSFYIVDDDFFVDMKRVEKICHGIIDNGWDITWKAQGINIKTGVKMTDEQIDLIEMAGCKKLHFGIESGSRRILDLVKKDITPEQINIVTEKFKKHKIACQYNFMVGFPTEEIDDVRKTTKTILNLLNESENNITSPLCTYVPYPGTGLYEMAIKDGYRVPINLEGWSHLDYGNSPWISDKKRKMCENLHFVSLFLSGSRGAVYNNVFKLGADLYMPIARYRMEKLDFRFMIEKKVKEMLVGY